MTWNITSGPSPASWPISSFVGDPPACEQDYYVVQYLYLVMHAPPVDPALGIPPFQKMRLADAHPDTSRQMEVIVTGSVIGCLLLIVGCLRLSLRRFSRHLVWGFDDWLMIPAILSGVSFCFLYVYGAVNWGLGRHMYSNTYKQTANFMGKTYIPQNFLLWVSSACVKLSLLASLYRLVDGRSKPGQITAIVLAFMVTVWGILAAGIPWFLDGNPRWLLDVVWAGHHSRLPPKILDVPAFAKALTSLHIIFDFMIFFLAIAIFWKLRIGLRTRIRICLLFSTGFASCLCAVMRFIVSTRIVGDTSWISVVLFRWSLADVTTALLVTNLPVLHGIISRRIHESQISKGTSEVTNDPRQYKLNNLGTRDGSTTSAINGRPERLGSFDSQSEMYHSASSMEKSGVSNHNMEHQGRGNSRF